VSQERQWVKWIQHSSAFLLYSDSQQTRQCTTTIGEPLIQMQNTFTDIPRNKV
jgi:hypothetical protein